ncbi:MAG: polysaccharide deacetylase family protein [Planctomycetes bacterium]|nr:polysaccharide deacetylase family protein [Planctomycetota bacterium]
MHKFDWHRGKTTSGLLLVLALVSGCNQLSLLLADLLPEGIEQIPQGALVVNVQIDAEREDVQGLTKIMDELKRRGISTTVYVTADYANRNALLINELYRDGCEIALHGYYTGEQLATMTYDEQKDLLTRALQALEGCRPCGTYKPIVGFRPQYFSQNEDTYRVLDELGLTYDCGFKVGQIYIDGHEADALPYVVDGHNFSAVPITTTVYGADAVYLCDIACALVQEYTPEQWSAVLHQAAQEAAQNEQPLVVLFHGWYTGDDEQYDYWQPFVDFLDELQGQAAFVGTQELVDHYAD